MSLGTNNSLERSLVSMVSSSVAVRALKSHPNNIMPLEFELQQYLLPGFGTNIQSFI